MEYLINTKFSSSALAIFILQMLISSFALAAKYDFVEEQQRSTDFEGSNSPDQITNQEWDIVSPDDFVNQEKENRKANYLSVVNLIKQKQLEQAGNKIASLFKQTPNDPYLYNLKALLDIFEGKKEEAKQSYQEAVKLDSNNSAAYFGLAKLAIADEQLDKAKEYAERAQIINNKIAGAYLLLAEIANKQGDTQNTEQILLNGYKKVQGSVNDETQIITVLGKFYIRQKQAEKILPLSKEVAGRYPNNSQALFILAGAQIVNNQKPLAEQTLRKIIRLEDKSNPKYRILLASLLGDHPGREMEVLRLLDEVYEINPDSPQALVLKTAFFVKRKQLQQALDTANKIEKLFPALAIGKQLKGEVHLADKKFDKALDAFQQSYQIKPNIKVLMVMSDLLKLQGKQSESINLLKQELGKHKNSIAIDFKLANIYQQQGSYKQAENHYKVILEEQPDNVLTLNNLAWIYAQQNNPEAVKLAERAYNMAPKSAAIADTYGYILLQQQRGVEKGLAILQQAAKAAPHAGDIQFHLAEAYSISGEKQKALVILESLNKETKSFSEKEKAKQLLSKLKAE